MVDFVNYYVRRSTTLSPSSVSPVAMMMMHAEVYGEQEAVLAVLDTGCNNTCHGDRWMQKYESLIGMNLKSEAADGNFKGVGGKVNVACKRTIPIFIKTLNDECLPGSIVSVELQDSDAPLLLSSVAQKKLGLVLDMGEHTAYSRTLEKELELVEHNGLPALRLLPGDFEVDGIALTSVPDESDEYESLPPLPDIGEVSGHLPLKDAKVRHLSKKQKKHLQESLTDMEKEDCAMWSSISGEIKRPTRMLPRGCRTFLAEIFAGAATLSLLAVQMGMPISQPVDVLFDARFDLLKKENRDRLEKIIEDDDPFLLALAPICGPWSSWQHVNMSKSEQMYEKVMEERKEWYPVLKWLAKIVKGRLRKGREVVWENPWPSMMWKLTFVAELHSGDYENAITGEIVELCRLDQCMYGLCHPDTGEPHQKATGMLLSSRSMKAHLRELCDGSHSHAPLAGGNLTKKAQEWPQSLCRAILRGALEGLHDQVLQVAFAGEHAQEEHEAMGPLDAIHDVDDLAEPVMKRRRIDLDEVDREEEHESTSEAMLRESEIMNAKEAKRRGGWLKLRKDKRVALRRLHTMMGHCSTPAMIRMLRSSQASKDILEAVPFFRCPTCEEVKKDEAPRSVKPQRPNEEMVFNFEVSIDVLEIHDSLGARHSILSMIDLATHYQIAVRVCSGGVPSSKVCAEAMNLCWFTPFGAPKHLVSDQGVHNAGKVSALLLMHGVDVRKTGVRAPHQLGVGERHGGLLKEIMAKAVHGRQLHGAEVISALCAETARTKNALVNIGGYSPVQWVLGHTPDDLTSFISHHFEENLGVHQQLIDQEQKPPQEMFMMQLLIRQSAKEAYMQVDASMKIRKAMLRKTTPLRGPYRPGDLVCFRRKERWFGPARVLAHEGKSSLWLVHGGVTVLIAETSCRPASMEEIQKKQVLELRPSRKRTRELIMGTDDDEEEYLPFADDGDHARHLRARHEGQAPYVDAIDVVALDRPLQASDPGMIAIPEDEEMSYTPYSPEPEQPRPLGGQPGVDGDLAVPPGLEFVRNLSTTTSSGQPEHEVSPVVSLTPEETSASPVVVQEPLPEGQDGLAPSQLTQALRQSPERLDGNPRAMHACEKSDPEEALAKRETQRWCFLTSREQTRVVKKMAKYRKKNVKKAGAGREVDYYKCSAETKEKLDASRLKEWTNWKQFTDSRWISEEEFNELRALDPKLKVIPTRWVEVNKAEEGQEEIMKSRIVARGDLEDASKMRTDSPTCSQLTIALTLILSACRNVTLSAGDISAAFLQGSKLDRTLVLRMPSDLPEENAGKYFLVSSTVYGTKDAPRGWLKNLHSTLLEKGFKPIPHEIAAYYLLEEDESLAGLVAVHVDDLMWTGGPTIESRMKEITDHYRFGKIEKDNFKYCGRDVSRDSAGVHVKCPSLIDRVKVIHLSAEERKKKDEKVGEGLRSQLRSVIGSLAWLSRVCRPDLAYSVSKLQSHVQNACYEDIKLANTLINIAQRTKQVGLTYPIGMFDFETVDIVGFQDASFANDSEMNAAGQKSGFRSQSGRVLCLADPSFRETGDGVLALLEWHSTTIKRVCRSTLQAESMSLLSGMEEGEHLRAVLHGLYNRRDFGDRKWQLESMDNRNLLLYTDCKSLAETVNQSGLHTVADKRLAIDLTSIRQQIWRKKGEEVGDPLLTDRIPSDGTTKLQWIPTEEMIADCLTKATKPGSLETLMKGQRIVIHPEKYNGCETKLDM